MGKYEVESGYVRKKVKPFTDFFSDIYPDIIAANVAEDTSKSINSVLVKTVTFIVTNQCNLRCSYCYQHNKGDSGKMSKETAGKLVDLMFDEFEKDNSRYISPSNSQAIILEFIGGEPFLEVDLIDWTVDYFRLKALEKNHVWALNYWISISTNGIDYLNPKVERFINKNKGRISVTISMDGDKELHDSCRKFPDGSPSYDIVEKSFKAHMEKFSHVGTKLTLAPGNISHLYSAHKHMMKMGVDEVSANCVYEKGWEVEHAKIMYSEMKLLADYVIENEYYKSVAVALFDKTTGFQVNSNDDKNWCGGTGSMISFDASGNAYPCLRYAPISLKAGVKPIVIGDLEHGLDSTEEHTKNISYLNEIKRSTQSTEECMNCPISSGCAWCSAYNYEETGDANKRVTYICIMHKARVLANVYYWNKLHQYINTGYIYKNNVPEEWALEIIDKDEFDMLNSLVEQSLKDL